MLSSGGAAALGQPGGHKTGTHTSQRAVLLSGGEQKTRIFQAWPGDFGRSTGKNALQLGFCNDFLDVGSIQFVLPEVNPHHLAGVEYSRFFYI
jgi:hypothetical protein